MSRTHARLAVLLVCLGLLVAACTDPPASPEGDPGGLILRTPTGGETHGDDPLPSPPPDPSGAPRALAERPWPCIGNGSDGARYELIFAHDGSGNLVANRPALESYARQMQASFHISAQRSGAPDGLVLRLLTTPDCSLVIRDVRLTTNGLSSFGGMETELRAQGFERSDRKYLVWAESTAYCGIGSLYSDDRSTQDNWNNTGPSYARVDRNCRGRGYVEAHEVAHNLGAVQNSAANSTQGFHTRDEYDAMSYPDGAPRGQTFVACPDQSGELLLDCNHDDFLDATPAPGSYLDTHWNIARSSWVVAATSPTTTPPPTTVPPTTTPPPPPTTTGQGRTETGLEVVPTRARVGQALTWTASVSGRCGPEGVVRFSLGGEPERFITAVPLSQGTAEVTVQFQSPGQYRIKAEYTGSERCRKSSDSVRRAIR